MIVAVLSFLVCLSILWSSGVLGDLLGWLVTKGLPWAFFPVTFFFGLFWVTDRLTPGWCLVVSFTLALLYALGGIVQLVVSFVRDHMLVISYSTMHDRFTNMPITLRVRVFGLVAVVLGSLGVWNPRPLQQVFLDHQTGMSWALIVHRFKDGPDDVPVPDIETPAAAPARHKTGKGTGARV